MAAGPEDPLTRVARWEAIRRRVDGRARPTATASSPLAELAEAARRVLDRSPAVAITITVESAGESSSIRLERVNDALTMTVDSGSTGNGFKGNRAATQLADLLRHDPTLLSGPDRRA